MKIPQLSSIALISATLAFGAAGFDFSNIPTFDANDSRFQDYQPPSADYSRGPCPALNSLANHGFLPRNGKNVTILDLIAGSYLGMGVSPILSASIVALVLPSQRFIGTWNLEDMRAHLMLIEHDVSLSRDDAAVGDNNKFNAEIWAVPLAVLKRGDGTVTPLLMGAAQGARVEAAKKRNPKTVYGPRAMVFGAFSSSLTLAALGDSQGRAPLGYIRSLFEEERLPAHLGWTTFPLKANTVNTIALAPAVFTGDPDLLKHAGQMFLSTPAEILGTLIPPGGLDGGPESDAFLIKLRDAIVKAIIDAQVSGTVNKVLPGII